MALATTALSIGLRPVDTLANVYVREVFFTYLFSFGVPPVMPV